VHIARRLPELPETGAAFGAGELSVDQMTVVARHAPAYTDHEVCELAKAATVTQLSVALSKYVHPEPDDTPEPKPEPVTGNDPRDALSASFDDHGRYRLNVDCDAANGAIIDKALAEARDHLFHNGNPHVTGVDALVEIARRSLGTVTSPSRRDLFRTYVHLDTDGEDGPAHAWLNGGPQLPAPLRDALLCDGVVIPLWSTEGRPVNVGRSRRTVPAHTRWMILDRTCRHPACTATRHLEVHHLHHWSQGGPTDTNNLLALCPHHHDAHHRGAFIITGNPDEPGNLKFFDARGRPIPNAAQPHPPNGPPPPAAPYLHPSGEPMQTKWLYFNDTPRSRDMG
jgi:hypothetical protein